MAGPEWKYVLHIAATLVLSGGAISILLFALEGDGPQLVALGAGKRPSGRTRLVLAHLQGDAAAICRLRENRVLQLLKVIGACTHPRRENSARPVNASPEPSFELIVRAACGPAADVIGFLHWK
jgi:hypothetical protein